MRALTAMLTLAIALGAGGLPAAAQQNPAPSPSPSAGSVYDGLEQIALTEAQVTQYIASQSEMEQTMGDASLEPGEPPDPAALAKLEAAAKKYKFANYDEFNTVAGNIALVLDGVDVKTKTYIGADKVLKQAMADVKADAKMSDSDKQEALAEIAEEMKNVTPVKFPGNIELVVKHYDALVAEETGQKL